MATCNLRALQLGGRFYWTLAERTKRPATFIAAGKFINDFGHFLVFYFRSVIDLSGVNRVVNLYHYKCDPGMPLD